MQPYVRDLFTAEARAACAEMWGITGYGEKLGASENFVFAVKVAGGEAVLRLTHSDRRPEEQVAAEIAFMRHLADAGVPVPEVLPAPNRAFLQRLEVANGYFTGVLMEKVPGTVLSRRFPRGSVMPEWIVREWGRAIGRMHRLSADLNREGVTFARNRWDRIYTDEADALRPEEQAVRPHARARQQLVEQFHSFAEDPDSFGLIHMDLHQGNIIVSEDRFTCIDFDDSSYHFFIQDIAMPLYYQFLFNEEGWEERLYPFFKVFLSAYFEEYRLDPEWFRHLPAFLRVRDYDLAIVLSLWHVPEADPWQQEIRRRMESGNPLADFPWEAWVRGMLS